MSLGHTAAYQDICHSMQTQKCQSCIIIPCENESQLGIQSCGVDCFVIY